MSKFTELYITKNQDRATAPKVSEAEMSENPIGAIRAGVPVSEVRKAMQKSGYSSVEISTIEEIAKSI